MARRPRTRAALVALFAVAGAAYLVWRAAFTLSPDFPVYSALFLGAEVWVFASALVFYRLMPPPDPAPAPTPDPPGRWTIDVFVATCGEDLDLVRTTAVAARDLDGTHTTWICDDADRAEIRALAEEIGVGYLARGTRTDFKAGNLNHALAHTGGDLVLFLDADHVPRRHLLTRLAGFFRDTRVAFVQIPQVYWNVDSFQHVEVGRTGALWHESSIFHHRLQRGADRVGGPLFVGTGALMRRSALDEIGGIATGSVTEDVHTSMRLHAAGWRSVYVDEALGVLLAPETPYAFARQRLRWAQGAMQLLRRENPLLQRGLGAGQRVAYLATWMGFLAAWPNLLFYLAPALYLLLGLAPVSVPAAVGVPIIAAHIALDLLIYRALAAPEARFLFGERFRMTLLAIQMRATLRLLRPDGLPFQVTPKGPHRGLPAWVWVPTAAVWALEVAGATAGLVALSRDAVPAGPGALCVALCAHFAVVGYFALANLLRHQVVDEVPSVAVDLAGRLGEVPVRVERLASTLAWLVPSAPLPDGSRPLVVEGLDPVLPAVVDARAAGRVRVAIEAEGADRVGLDRFLFEEAVPAFLAAHAGAPPVPPPGQMTQESFVRADPTPTRTKGGAEGLPPVV